MVKVSHENILTLMPFKVLDNISGTQAFAKMIKLRKQPAPTESLSNVHGYKARDNWDFYKNQQTLLRATEDIKIHLHINLPLKP